MTNLVYITRLISEKDVQDGSLYHLKQFTQSTLTTVIHRFLISAPICNMPQLLKAGALICNNKSRLDV